MYETLKRLGDFRTSIICQVGKRSESYQNWA